MIPSPRLAACVSIVEVALARPLRVRDELTGAVYVRRGAQGELPRHHRRDGEKQADASGSLLVVAAVGPGTEALDALSEALFWRTTSPTLETVQPSQDFRATSVCPRLACSFGPGPPPVCLHAVRAGTSVRLGRVCCGGAGQ